MKRFILGIPIAIALIIVTAIPVLAVPTSITNVIVNPSNTSIYITWVKSDATQTLVRYSTTTYPATTADGTQAYVGTAFTYELTGLTAGRMYYFSLWGYDGAAYSATAANIAVSTLAVAIPSGAKDATPAAGLAYPGVHARTGQAASNAQFNFEPFTTIIAVFNNATGGLGMPVGNAWETLCILGITVSGMATYIKTKIFFLAFLVVFALSLAGVAGTLIQAELIYYELAVAGGVWAIDKYLQ